MQPAKKPYFNRFELLSKLGGGLHGRVFLAWDPRLERKVALKILNRQRDTQTTLEQFFAEARTVAKIAHAHVVPLFEAGSENGLPYLVFEFVDGTPLKNYLKTTVLDVPTASAKFTQIAEGVAAAHALDIAHLNLSPNNILVDSRGTLRVMDFGLSRFVTSSTKIDNEENIQGTPRYMSPEHLAGAPLDRRTDVFALGLIFYEILAGHPAANAEKLKDIAAQIQQTRFDWQVMEGRGAPPEVLSVIRDALSRVPARRFKHAGEMLGALREASAVAAAGENHGLAVQFLLRRLQRRPEFPAFSNSINEINRLTDENNQSGLHELAAVVMRDFSLTNRLLKIANTAIFARSDVGTTTVAQAIARLGTKTVRLLCNGLLMFEHMKGDHPMLQDALVESLVAGLLGRLLALQLCRELAEEAFVAAMFNRLGRNLLIYYLEDEYAEILHRVAGGMPLLQAERAVLATTSHEVGAAVAASWKFSAGLISSMAPLPVGVLPTPAHDAERMRCLAHFPSELCALAAGNGAQMPVLELERLVQRFQRIFRTNATDLADALALALEKFDDIAPTLQVSAHTNGFCQRTSGFLTAFRSAQASANLAVEPD